MNARNNPSPQSPRTRLSVSRLLVLALIGLCVLFVASYSSRSRQLEQEQGQIAYWENAVATEEQHGAELDAELQSVDSAEYIAQIAREYLGLSIPGDTVIIPVEATPTPLPASAISATVPIPAAATPTPATILDVRATPVPPAAGEPIWRQWLAVLAAEE